MSGKCALISPIARLFQKLVTCLGVMNSISSCRVHGRVPRHAVKWRDIPVVYNEQLKDIKYEKGHGEGIAKV